MKPFLLAMVLRSFLVLVTCFPPSVEVDGGCKGVGIGISLCPNAVIAISEDNNR